MAYDEQKWRKEVVAPAGGFSPPVIIPQGVSAVAATAVPGAGGSATVQHTMAPADDVFTGTVPANQWVPWEAGAVVVTTSRGLRGSVTAVRLAAVGFDAILQVVGHEN